MFLLAARATRAFLEYAPMRYSNEETERIYRVIPYGPLLDVFVLDMRSYRGPNTYNRQESPGAETAYLGRAADGVVEAGPGAVARDLEGDRVRYAAGRDRRRRQG